MAVDKVLRSSLCPTLAGQPGHDIAEASLAREAIQPINTCAARIHKVFPPSSRPPPLSATQRPKLCASKEVEATHKAAEAGHPDLHSRASGHRRLDSFGGANILAGAPERRPDSTPASDPTSDASGDVCAKRCRPILGDVGHTWSNFDRHRGRSWPIPAHQLSVSCANSGATPAKCGRPWPRSAAHLSPRMGDPSLVEIGSTFDDFGGKVRRTSGEIRPAPSQISPRDFPVRVQIWQTSSRFRADVGKFRPNKGVDLTRPKSGGHRGESVRFRSGLSHTHRAKCCPTRSDFDRVRPALDPDLATQIPTEFDRPMIGATQPGSREAA